MFCLLLTSYSMKDKQPQDGYTYIDFKQIFLSTLTVQMDNSSAVGYSILTAGTASCQSTQTVPTSDQLTIVYTAPLTKVS